MGNNTGLASYVKEVTAHIDSDSGRVTSRGLFRCKQGHTFTAVVSDLRNPPSMTCHDCNGGSRTLLADMLSVKMKFLKLSGLVAPANFNMSLTKMVAHEDRRKEAATLGRDIEISNIGKLEGIADRLSYYNGPGAAAELMALVRAALTEIIKINEGGDTSTAIKAKEELGAVLQGSRED